MLFNPGSKPNELPPTAAEMRKKTKTCEYTSVTSQRRLSTQDDLRRTLMSDTSRANELDFS